MPLLPDSDPDTYAIIGAAMEVHRHLGLGFLEAVYAEAMHYELMDRDIPFAAEVWLPITFKGRRLVTRYRADLVCYGKIIVELKALRETGGSEMAQVLNYLKASGCSRGLLLNFGTPRLTYHRFIWSADNTDGTDALGAVKRSSASSVPSVDHALLPPTHA